MDFGDITPASYKTRLSQWMADPMARKERLGEGNFQRLAAATIRDFPLMENHLPIPLMNLIFHPLYHSIASRLDSTRGRDKIDYAVRRLVGHYRIYRPSALERGSHMRAGSRLLTTQLRRLRDAGAT